jgi:uncharacterized protein YegL
MCRSCVIVYPGPCDDFGPTDFALLFGTTSSLNDGSDALAWAHLVNFSLNLVDSLTAIEQEVQFAAVAYDTSAQMISKYDKDSEIVKDAIRNHEYLAAPQRGNMLAQGLEFIRDTLNTKVNNFRGVSHCKHARFAIMIITDGAPEDDMNNVLQIVDELKALGTTIFVHFTAHRDHVMNTIGYIELSRIATTQNHVIQTESFEVTGSDAHAATLPIKVCKYAGLEEQPALIAFDLNMSSATLTMEFNVAVRVDSLNVTNMVLQNSSSIDIYPPSMTMFPARQLVNSSLLQTNGNATTKAIVQLGVNDFRAIQMVKYLAIGRSTSFLSIDDAVKSANNVILKPFPSCNALQVRIFTADVAPPELVGFDLDLEPVCYY